MENKNIHSEDEVENGLNEIYQDGNGGLVDVTEMETLRKRSGLFWFVGFVVFVLIGMLVFSYVYNRFYINLSDGKSDVVFEITGKNEILAGEEPMYEITYKNLSNVELKNVSIELKYPENFIFLDSDPQVAAGNNVWHLEDIGVQHVGKIKIKGKMIDFRGETGVLLASMTYTPANFSSEFKKSANLATVIKDIGIGIDFEFLTTALIGEENELKIKIKKEELGRINNFKIIMTPQENVEISNKKINEDGVIDYTQLRSEVWEINEIMEDEFLLPIRYTVSKKNKDKQNIELFFYVEGEETEIYNFYKKEIELNIVKSDLNLTLIINGSREDQGVEFDQKLNYSIVYSNKGESTMNDLVLMAVLDSDFLDWETLDDKAEGKEKGNTITWTKDEVPDFENLEPGDEGVLDFAIDASSFEILDDGEYAIHNFVQYSVGEEKSEVSTDSQSNPITLKINSNVNLDQQIKYFNDDNIPVGTGPHPPRVDEETSYKVYWNLTNSLHDLSDLVVKTKLPDYIFFGDKKSVSVGVIQFDENTREVVWDVGRLPAKEHEVIADFNIIIKPQEEDRDRIMVLLPGADYSAIDTETDEILSGVTKVKTTKLEDDEVATSDGIIE